MEERTDIIKALAPISLTTRNNPFNLTFEEALDAIVAPSHLSSEINPEMAYMFLCQYKNRSEALLDASINVLQQVADRLHEADYRDPAKEITKFIESLKEQRIYLV